MKRGVIASPIEFDFKLTGVGLRPTLSHEMLRYYLLYWDEIIIPDNNLVSMGTPYEQELADFEFVKHPMIRHIGRFAGNDFANAILKGQFELASMLTKDTKTDWVLHQSNASMITSLENDHFQKDALRLRLTNILPVPTEAVPFQDIVEFKQLRSDEFNHLHELLDELYLQILREPDQQLAEKRALNELTSLINDLDSLTKERFSFINKLSIEPSYNIKVKDLINYPMAANAGDIFVNYINSGVAAASYTLAATTIGLAIGAVSNIQFGVNRQSVPDNSDNKPRLSYIAHAAKEGLIGL